MKFLYYYEIPQLLDSSLPSSPPKPTPAPPTRPKIYTVDKFKDFHVPIRTVQRPKYTPSKAKPNKPNAKKKPKRKQATTVGVRNFDFSTPNDTANNELQPDPEPSNNNDDHNDNDNNNNNNNNNTTTKSSTTPPTKPKFSEPSYDATVEKRKFLLLLLLFL